MTLPHQFRDVEYDSESRRLTIRFQVGSYQYEQVPYELALGFRKAWLQRDVRPGEAVWIFDSQIEGKYKSARIGS